MCNGDLGISWCNALLTKALLHRDGDDASSEFLVNEQLAGIERFSADHRLHGEIQVTLE
jgi:hypothetical protein